MPNIIALASLYKPLEFLEDRIKNLNLCDTTDVLVWWLDVSPKRHWVKVQELLKSCEFEYMSSHTHQRQTLYWAWNWIIKQSKQQSLWPKYFCNTNVDDILHPEYFQKMSSYLDEHNDKLIVCCNWYNTNIKHQFEWKPKHDSMSEVDPKLTLGHFPMWDSSLHDSVGMFDGRMVCIGDSDFWSRIKNVHGPNVIGKISKPLGCYLSHSNNLYYKSQGPNGESGEAYDRALMMQRGQEENTGHKRVRKNKR